MVLSLRTRNGGISVLMHSCTIVSGFFIGVIGCKLLWQNFEVSKYDPKGSSTSKIVRCNNRLCMQRNKCLGASNTCPYRVSYVSDQTSTSGILVEDVLHLTTEDSHHEYVEAYITFG